MATFDSDDELPALPYFGVISPPRPKEPFRIDVDREIQRMAAEMKVWRQRQQLHKEIAMEQLKFKKHEESRLASHAVPTLQHAVFHEIMHDQRLQQLSLNQLPLSLLADLDGHLSKCKGHGGHIWCKLRCWDSLKEMTRKRSNLLSLSKE